MTWSEFLTTKFGLWIDVRSSNDNQFHGSGRTVERSGILLQIERAADASDGDLVCYVFSLEDGVADLNTSSEEILTIEKESKSMLFMALINHKKFISTISPLVMTLIED